jgi:hypothetical protein
MTGWKVDLDALVQEAMTLAKSVRVEPPVPRAIIEPPAPHTIAEPVRLPPVSPSKSERDEIREYVLNFKAHQERFAREREEFATSLLKKMLQRSSPADRNA